VRRPHLDVTAHDLSEQRATQRRRRGEHPHDEAIDVEREPAAYRCQEIVRGPFAVVELHQRRHGDRALGAKHAQGERRHARQVSRELHDPLRLPAGEVR
jgi:hypothetical protein